MNIYDIDHNLANGAINIVIPMAGLGSRFKDAGYQTPKPFIRFNGKPMIAHVIENLAVTHANFILIGQNSHLLQEKEKVQEIARDYNATFIGIDGLTEGAACTVLHAIRYINNELPLLTANSDQLVDFDLQKLITDANARDLDGSILTFKDPGRDPKWSYVLIDHKTDLVLDAKEKIPLSDYATVGLYYFKRGKDFINAAVQMMLDKNKSNNEYYVCPMYNYLIQNGQRVGIYNIETSRMHGLGTPDDFEIYINRLGCTR